MKTATITRKPTARAAKLAELESRIVDASAPAAPASKPVKADKAKAASKAASKAAPASKGKAAPVKVKSRVNLAFAIGQGFRPVAGVRLVAYSAAWMAATGFDKGAPIARATLAKIAGETAISYHTKHGNFISTPDGIAITAKGKSAFGMRAVDEQLRDAFMAVMRTGEASKVASVGKGQIVALAA